MSERYSENDGSHRDVVLRVGPCRRLSVAPMMDWTDRHYRVLARLIAPQALLYTEMVVDAAVLNGDRQRLLGFDPSESPVALQLGGSDPQRLAQAARVGADYGYDEINLNIGCPSGRVQKGRFGACLMREPERVAECVSAIREVVAVPVTVKTRIGVDHDDSEAFLHKFAGTVIDAGIDTLIVHARKAWLEGLSPKQNREVPPLDYTRVERLRASFESTPIVINGGIADLGQFRQKLEKFDGVMIGRAAYQQPMLLGEMQREVTPDFEPRSAVTILKRYLPYIEEQLSRGVRLHSMTRHMMGLFAGQSGAREWRQQLSKVSQAPRSGLEYLHEIARQRADAA